MSAPNYLAGVAGYFSADSIECLVRTAAEAVCGDPDALSDKQRTLAEEAYDLVLGEFDTDAPKSGDAVADLTAVAEELEITWADLLETVIEVGLQRANAVNDQDLIGHQLAFLVRELGAADAERVLREKVGPPIWAK